MPRPHLKLLTYNIHKGFNITNRKFVLHQIRETLQETNVDMAFLQEIHGEHTGHQLTTKNWPEVSQYEFLADQLWPHYAYGKKPFIIPVTTAMPSSASSRLMPGKT